MGTGSRRRSGSLPWLPALLLWALVCALAGWILFGADLHTPHYTVKRFAYGPYREEQVYAGWSRPVYVPRHETVSAARVRLTLRFTVRSGAENLGGAGGTPDRPAFEFGVYGALTEPWNVGHAWLWYGDTLACSADAQLEDYTIVHLPGFDGDLDFKGTSGQTVDQSETVVVEAELPAWMFVGDEPAELWVRTMPEVAVTSHLTYGAVDWKTYAEVMVQVWVEE